MTTPVNSHWTRRARPLLGTLVEAACSGRNAAALDAALAEIAAVQACMSRFDTGSDIGRFHAAAAGDAITIDARTAEVLRAAATLHAESGGLFDIALGSAQGTEQGGHALDGLQLRKLDGNVRLDLGGLAKGYAVDRAVQMLQAHGCQAGWVNAGGDLRAFGDVEVPVLLRDERTGGVRQFATLAEGAFATSHYGSGARAVLHRPPSMNPVTLLVGGRRGSGSAGPPWSHSQGRGAADVSGGIHLSVAAPLCLWADALTKLVALTGRVDHPVLATHQAQAWLH